jgi:hypothetical protein
VSGVGAVASYAGYITTWVICGATALVCAVLLFFVPKLAFADVEAELPIAEPDAEPEKTR